MIKLVRPSDLPYVAPKPYIPPEMETAFAQHNEIQRLLSEWKAPVLSDHVIESYAKIYRTSRYQSIVPFFVWLSIWEERWR